MRQGLNRAHSFDAFLDYREAMNGDCRAWDYDNRQRASNKSGYDGRKMNAPQPHAKLYHGTSNRAPHERSFRDLRDQESSYSRGYPQYTPAPNPKQNFSPSQQRRDNCSYGTDGRASHHPSCPQYRPEQRYAGSYWDCHSCSGARNADLFNRTPLSSASLYELDPRPGYSRLVSTSRGVYVSDPFSWDYPRGSYEQLTGHAQVPAFFRRRSSTVPGLSQRDLLLPQRILLPPVATPMIVQERIRRPKWRRSTAGLNRWSMWS